MANTKKYWKGLEQLDNDSKFVESSNNEFAEQLPVTEFLGNKEELEDATTTRRDFLKYLGFGVAAASLAACETPVTKAAPVPAKTETKKPEKALNVAEGDEIIEITTNIIVVVIFFMKSSLIMSY